MRSYDRHPDLQQYSSRRPARAHSGRRRLYRRLSGRRGSAPRGRCDLHGASIHQPALSRRSRAPLCSGRELRLPEAIAAALGTDTDRWDYIIYNLGATKAANFADFNRINFGFLRNFLDALRSTGKIPERLLYMSSLSALGKGRRTRLHPMADTMIPNPDTRYGLSKMKAETLLDTTTDIPWTILRPTGGLRPPRAGLYLMMVKCIDRHFDFGVGFRRQMLTFIYVEDPGKGGVRRRGCSCRQGAQIYRQRAPKLLAGRFQAHSGRGARHPVYPARQAPALDHPHCVCGGREVGVAKLKPSTLNTDKYNILRQRNRQTDCSRAVADFGFAPRVGLREGIREVIRAWRADEAAAAAKGR